MSTSPRNDTINKLTSAVRLATIPSSSASSEAIHSKPNHISDQILSTSTAAAAVAAPNGINNSKGAPIYFSPASQNQTLTTSVIHDPSTSAAASSINPSTNTSCTLLTVPVNALQSLRKHRDFQVTAAANRDRGPNSPLNSSSSSPEKSDETSPKVESVKLLLRLRGLSLYKHNSQSPKEDQPLDPDADADADSASAISKEDGELSDKGHLSTAEHFNSADDSPVNLSDGEIASEDRPLQENGINHGPQPHPVFSAMEDVSRQQLPTKPSPTGDILTAKHSLTDEEEESLLNKIRLQPLAPDEGHFAKDEDKFPPPPPPLVPASALSRRDLHVSIPRHSNQPACAESQDKVPPSSALLPSSALIQVEENVPLIASSSSTPKSDFQSRSMSCCVCDKICHVRNMIECKLCSVPTHLYCLSPPLSELPCFPWKCAKCIRKRSLLSRTVHACTQTDDRASIYISDDNRSWLPLKLRNKPHLAADLPSKPNHRSLPHPAAAPRARYVRPIVLANGAVVPVQYTGEAAKAVFGSPPPANMANVRSCEHCGTFHSGEIAGNRFCSVSCARVGGGAVFSGRGRGGRGRGRGRGRGTRGRGSRKRGALLTANASQHRYAIRGIGGLERLAQVARATGSDNSGGYTDSSDGENQNESKDSSDVAGATMDRRLTRGRKEVWQVGYEPNTSTGRAADTNSDSLYAEIAPTQSGKGTTMNGSNVTDAESAGRTSSKSKTKFQRIDPAVAAIPIGQPGHVPAGKSGIKPGKGFKFCHVCFELVANRRFICLHCNTPNPSSRRTATNPTVVDSFGKPIVKKRRVPESPLDGFVSIKKKRKTDPSSVASSAAFAASATDVMINAPSNSTTATAAVTPSASGSNNKQSLNIPKLKAISIATNTIQDASPTQEKPNLTPEFENTSEAKITPPLPAKIVVKKTSAKKSSVMGMLNPQGFYGQSISPPGPVYRGLPNGVMQDQTRNANLSTILNGHSTAPSHEQADILHNPPRLSVPVNPMYNSLAEPPSRPRSSEPRFRVLPRQAPGQLQQKEHVEKSNFSVPERAAAMHDIGSKTNSRTDVNETSPKNARSIIATARKQEYRPIVISAVVQNAGQESGRTEGK